MAITRRGTSTGPNSNGTSTTISLPAGAAAGDVTIIAAVQSATAEVLTLSPPAGWTTLVSGDAALICYRVFQSGDPTSVTLTSNSSGTAFWESCAIGYIGVDNTNPIDASNSCFLFASSSGQTSKCRAPSVNPGYANDMLCCVYMRGDEGGGVAFTAPSGTTARVSTTAGPCVAIADKQLTTAAATGTIDAAWDNLDQILQFGAQIALKTAGDTPVTPASPAVTYAGMLDITSGSDASSLAFPLGQLNPQTGDLVVVLLTTTTTGTVTPPSGYTTVRNSHGVGLYTHAYTAGDPQTPSFSVSVAAFLVGCAFLLRKTGTGTGTPVLDTSAVTTGTGATATATLTPAQSTEALLCFWADSGSTAGTITVPTGLTSDFENNFGPNYQVASTPTPSNPTGAFTANLGTTDTTVAISALFMVPSSGTTLGLTGVSATGAVGSVSDGVASLSGVAATGGIGSVSAGISLGLAGNGATGAVGTTGAALSSALSAVSSSGAAGNAALQRDGSAGLTGTSASGAAATPGVSLALALEGNAATTQAGAVVVFTPPLTGVAALGAAGNVAPSQGTQGVTAAGSVGAMGVGPHLQLSGNTLSGETGSLSPASTLQLTGAHGTGAAGTPGASITLALSGNDATVGVGALGSRFAITLPGATALAQAGQIASGTTLGTTGVSATGLAELTTSVTPLSSVGASLVAGIIGIDLSVGVTGCTAVGLTGFLSQPLGGNQSHVFILTYDHERTVRIPSG